MIWYWLFKPDIMLSVLIWELIKNLEINSDSSERPLKSIIGTRILHIALKHFFLNWRRLCTCIVVIWCMITSGVGQTKEFCDMQIVQCVLYTTMVIDIFYYPSGISWLQGNAESLPAEDNQFDAYTIAFGIRNCTHVKKVCDHITSDRLNVLWSRCRFTTEPLENLCNC